jgi:hypothetical protein
MSEGSSVTVRSRGRAEAALRWATVLFVAAFLTIGFEAFLTNGPAYGSDFVIYAASICVVGFSSVPRPYAGALLLAGSQLLVVASFGLIRTGPYQVPLAVLLWVLFFVPLSWLLGVPLVHRGGRRTFAGISLKDNPQWARLAAASLSAAVGGISALIGLGLTYYTNALGARGGPPGWSGGALAGVGAAMSSIMAAAVTFPAYLSLRKASPCGGRLAWSLTALSVVSVVAEFFFRANWWICVPSLIAIDGSLWAAWVSWKVSSTPSR